MSDVANPALVAFCCIKSHFNSKYARLHLYNHLHMGEVALEPDTLFRSPEKKPSKFNSKSHIK